MIFKILLFFLFSLSLNAATLFRWLPNKSQTFNGTCYEVDSKTLGKNFIHKVKREKCKPKLTALIFEFTRGKCYEVDDKTGGKEYAQNINLRGCKTKKIKKGFLKIKGITSCYEYDIPSKGKDYYKKLSQEECLSLEKANQFFWKSLSKTKGNCYIKVMTQDGIGHLKTKPERCRPKQVKYIFIKKNSFFSGECYESHPESIEKYILKTSKKDCRPKNTFYIFHKQKDATHGYCYEIDQETKGENYISTVEINNCKDSL